MQEHLRENIFAPEEITAIGKMIMATKLPQSPVSLPDMILCDADLDYLGRTDFEEISTQLRNEWLSYGFLTEESDFDQRQVDFFEKHHYFTATSIQNRYPVEMKNLEILKQRLLQSKP